jgi:hypothetical protein
MLKADVEVRVHKFGIGGSYRYYSKMQNIDNAFQTIETLTASINKVAPGLPGIQGVNYWETHNGFGIFDARTSFRLSEKSKLSIVCNNMFNVSYFLRPLKIEAPRTIALQYVYTL